MLLFAINLCSSFETLFRSSIDALLFIWSVRLFNRTLVERIGTTGASTVNVPRLGSAGVFVFDRLSRLSELGQSIFFDNLKRRDKLI